MSQEVYIEASVEGLKGKMSDQNRVYNCLIWCHFPRYHKDFFDLILNFLMHQSTYVLLNSPYYDII